MTAEPALQLQGTYHNINQTKLANAICSVCALEPGSSGLRWQLIGAPRSGLLLPVHFLNMPPQRLFLLALIKVLVILSSILPWDVRILHILQQQLVGFLSDTGIQ